MDKVEEFLEWFDRRQEGIRAREERIERMRANGSSKSRIRRVEKQLEKIRRSIGNRALRDGFTGIGTMLPHIK